MPYCPNCGAETEAGAAFCGSCGARLEGEAPPAPPRPPAPQRLPWAILGGIIALVVLVVGGVFLYNALAGDEDGQERVAASSPTARATPEVTATVEDTPLPEETPRWQPTAELPASGHATPEEAIGAYLAQYGLEYAGDCAYADHETDIGSYCSVLWEDRGDQLIYAAGLAFSEPDTWLLLAQQGESGGWLVVDAAEFVPGPEDTVPPWP